MSDVNSKPVEEVPSKPKSRRLLWLMLALVGLGSAGGAGWFFYLKPKGEKVQSAPEPKPVNSVVYLPLDPVVINLTGEGGDRLAQLGITFQIRDAKLVEDVKKVLPSIRNRILISLSERKAEDLLTKEGKERLAADILVEAGRAFGVEPTAPSSPAGGASAPEKAASSPSLQAPNPVVQVLFSSLIIQ